MKKIIIKNLEINYSDLGLLLIITSPFAWGYCIGYVGKRLYETWRDLKNEKRFN